MAVGLLSVVSESDRVASNMTFEYAAALLATGRWLDAELAFDFHSASNPEDPQLLDWAQALHGLAIGEARRDPAAQTSADRGRVEAAAGWSLNPSPWFAVLGTRAACRRLPDSRHGSPGKWHADVV